MSHYPPLMSCTNASAKHNKMHPFAEQLDSFILSSMERYVKSATLIYKFVLTTMKETWEKVCRSVCPTHALLFRQRAKEPRFKEAFFHCSNKKQTMKACSLPTGCYTPLNCQVTKIRVTWCWFYFTANLHKLYLLCIFTLLLNTTYFTGLSPKGTALVLFVICVLGWSVFAVSIYGLVMSCCHFLL